MARRMPKVDCQLMAGSRGADRKWMVDLRGGYLAHQKQFPRETLRYDYAYGPTAVLKECVC